MNVDVRREVSTLKNILILYSYGRKCNIDFERHIMHNEQTFGKLSFLRKYEIYVKQFDDLQSDF